MARDRDHHDFLPAVVATMERPPALHLRLVSLLVVLLVILAGLWAFWSRMDIVVSAQGEIVPAGKVKVVQATEPGVIEEIRVRDGQVVEAGGRLMALNSTSAEAEREQLEIRRARTRLTVQRLRAELGQPVEIGDGIDLRPHAVTTEKSLYRANQDHFAETVAQLEHKREQSRSAWEVSRKQIDKLRARIRHLENRLSNKQDQAERGLIPGQEVEDLAYELTAARQEVDIAREKSREAGIRMAAAGENLVTQRMARSSRLYRELAKAERELKTVEQDLVKARERAARQVFRAPVSGIVQQLSVHTIGAVVRRGQNLLVIVPEGMGLEMDARIPNKDIGFVHASQAAKIKVDAFEFTRYGHIEGTLQWVGADAVLDEKRGPEYPVRIALATTAMQTPVGDRAARIVPGMRATADIVIGQRRLIEYFIDPILRYRETSLRER